MATFNAGVFGAWIVDKHGNRREIPSASIHITNAKENLEGVGEQITHLDEAMQAMSFTATLTGEAAQGLLRMFRHLDYKRYVAPLRYRVQPPRSEIIKVGGQYLTSKAAFTRRLLSGKD